MQQLRKFWSAAEPFLQKSKRVAITIFERPEKVFLTIAVIFGLVTVFCMPIFMVPDEAAHFDRAYQVGGGHLVSQVVPGDTGGAVPGIPVSGVAGYKQRSPVSWGHYFDRIHQKDIKFVSFPSSALYSPLPYVPQAIGIDFARLVYPSLGTMVLMGRIANLAVYILLVYIAIRIARQGKWVYVVAALFPVAIQEAASLSTDVMTTGLGFITIAYLHSLFYSRDILRRKQFILLVLLAIGLGLTKQTNILFLLPVLFLGRRLGSSVWKRLAAGCLVFGACLLAVVGWFLLVKYQHYNLAKSTQPGVDQLGQVKFIIMHPLAFAKVLFKSYVYEGFRGIAMDDFYLMSMVGIFSWFLYKLPLLLIMSSYAILFLAFMYRDKLEQPRLSLLRKLACVQTLTFVVSLIGIAGALYIVWTSVGAPQVSGVQGRYLIPTIPLLIPLFALMSRWVKIAFDRPYRMGMIVAAVSGTNLLAMLILTVKYFY